MNITTLPVKESVLAIITLCFTLFMSYVVYTVMLVHPVLALVNIGTCIIPGLYATYNFVMVTLEKGKYNED